MRKLLLMYPVLVLTVCFLGMPSTLYSIERVLINKPNPYVVTGELLETVEKIAQDAAHIANRLYGDYIRVEYQRTDTKPAGFDFEIEPLPIETPQFSSFTVTMKRTSDGLSSNPEAIYGEFDHRMSKVFAAVIFYQWGAFRNYLMDEMAAPPVFVDEMNTDVIASSILAPGQPASLFPSSITNLRNGNILTGMGMVAVEMDSNFKIISTPGSTLLESGNYTSSYGVGATPAGTVLLKPSIGREIYQLIPGVTRPRRIRVNLGISGPFAVFPDGSFVLADWTNKKAYRYVKRDLKELSIFSGEWSYLSAMTVGPEGNLWVYDSNVRSIRIYSPEGEFLHVIIPLIDAAVGTADSIAVYADGSYVLHYNLGSLMRFDRKGIPIWGFKEYNEGESLPMLASVTVNSTNGTLYLADMQGKRIVKFLDVSALSEPSSPDTPEAGDDGVIPFEEKIVLLNTKLMDQPDETKLIMEKAKLYEEAGAFEMAKYLVETAFDIDPFDSAIAEYLDSLEVEILKAKVDTYIDKTIQVLDTIGPASAKPMLDATLRTYEQILSISPYEMEITDRIEELKGRFSERESPELSQQKPLQIVELSIENAFPSLMQYYRNQPIGSISVKNPHDEPVKQLKASVFIKKYMDFPTETEAIPSVAADETVGIDLYLILNTSVFELQEDLPVQVEITLDYAIQNSSQQQKKNASITIYRRTALSWDDTGKIASFIMPREKTITEFSHRVGAWIPGIEPYQFNKRLFRAIRICDGVGTYGIHYVEDPDSPISKILGQEHVIDTIRFPRTTLLIQSGDCDDSTALLGSLLESLGISTAIMTSPGHVFLAFDSNEPASNAWLLQAEPFEILEHDGTIWIPLETTVLKDGFFKAWESASALVSKYDSEGAIEFIPVETKRALYPALPLPDSNFTVVEPAVQAIDERFSESLTLFEQRIFAVILKRMTDNSHSLSGKKKLKIDNMIGILHAQFGKREEADSLFRSLIDQNPDYLSSYINWANLKLSAGEIEDGVLILEDALAEKPGSALINLLLAQSHYKLGNQKAVETYYNRAREASPHLAKRFAYLVDQEESASRASEAAADIIPLWDTGEE